MKKIERMCKRTMQRAARAGVGLAACIGVRFPDAAVEATVIVGAAVTLGWAVQGWRK